MAIFAPAQSRQLLATSGDPVYALCKAGETSSSQTASTASINSQATLGSNVLSHLGYCDGNIIVTADYTGQIKVFRQDSAWAMRKPDTGDTASIRARTKTNLARGSTSSVRPSGFWRGSSNPNVSGASGAPSTHSSSRRNSVASTNASQTALTAHRNLDVPKIITALPANGRGNSPSPSQRGRAKRTESQQDGNHLTTPSPDRLGRQKSTPQERLMIQEDGQSLAFYNLKAQRRESLYSDHSGSRSPDRGGRRGSISSGHSEELDADEAKSFVDADEGLSNDDMVCKTCGARTFNAFKVQAGSHKGETKLRCSVYIPNPIFISQLDVNMYSNEGHEGQTIVNALGSILRITTFLGRRRLQGILGIQS